MLDHYESFRGAIKAASFMPPEELIADGQIHRFSTNGHRSDRAGWYVLHVGHASFGSFGCWRSGLVQSWKPELPHLSSSACSQRAARDYQQALVHKQRAQWTKNQALIRKLENELEPAGDPVHRYLEARGLGTWTVPSCIFQHPALPYWHLNEQGQWKELGRFPAMLAPVIRDGQVLAYHRTYLGEGCKAKVPQPKKLTRAAGSLRGACIPLAQPHDGLLGVAEGIETAAAAGQASGLPVVAAYSSGALANYIWPQEVEHLLIFADNDQAGLMAAERLEARVRNHGLTCKTLTPSKPGLDWADIWKGEKA